MLHSLVTQTSDTPMQGKAPSLSPAKESRQFLRAMGSNYAAGAAGPASRSGSSGRAAANAQSTYGNQAVLRTLNRSSTLTVLQRKCACEGAGSDCETCAEKKEGTLQRSVGNHATPNGVPPIVHEVLSSPGSPLDAGTRAFMEPRFGHDFSDVRVHTDSLAAESARSVNALAYTVGNHIVLGAGHHSPAMNPTRRLLAHELAHVIQQRGLTSLQGFRISGPDEPMERQAAQAEEAVLSGRSFPALSNVTGTLQRQTCDPLTDPFCEGKKEEKKEEKALDPKTERAYEACPDLCKKFPPVEIAPDVFVAVCDDSVLMKGPDVRPVGCMPNRQGKVGFFSGSPAWQMPATADCNFQVCTVTGKGSKAGSTKGIEIGYIQTVEDCLSGGVYFQKDASGKWVWAGNKWWCVKNTRDGEETSTAPWYGDAKGNFGPKPFPDCPVMVDTPSVTLDARQKTTQIAPGVEGGGNPLRRLRIDGKFHLWLVARLPGGSLVYIHHWDFECFVVAVLASDNADPCNVTEWQKIGAPKLTGSGPLKGGATSVESGDVANKVKTDCSTK